MDLFRYIDANMIRFPSDSLTFHNVDIDFLTAVGTQRKTNNQILLYGITDIIH